MARLHNSMIAYAVCLFVTFSTASGSTLYIAERQYIGGPQTTGSVALSADSSAANVSGHAAATSWKSPTEPSDVSYFWPSGRGPVGAAGASAHATPFDLPGSLSWTWNNPVNKYFTSPVAVLLDDQKNLYLCHLKGIFKMTHDGAAQVWAYEGQPNEELYNAAALHNGHIFSTSSTGRTFALRMDDGSEVWSTFATMSADGNNGFVMVFEGVVLTRGDAEDNWRGQDSCCGPGGESVTALNSTTGEVMWNFKPDVPTWNFVAAYAGDGTFIFQDLEGRAYRNSLSDGALLWKVGGKPSTWTDGGAALGPNGVVYTVNTDRFGANLADGPNGTGSISAFALSDGRLLWTRATPRVPNNVGAIGTLSGHGLAYVQPMGQQSTVGGVYDVRAYDPETGAELWVFHGPTQTTLEVAGDLKGATGRTLAGIPWNALTMPNPWSAPTISGGIVFVGNEVGHLYALRDLNGDGVVLGPDEVSLYVTGAAFAGSSSPAIAPGVMAAASIDTLFVFK